MEKHRGMLTVNGKEEDQWGVAIHKVAESSRTRMRFLLAVLSQKQVKQVWNGGTMTLYIAF